MTLIYALVVIGTMGGAAGGFFFKKATGAPRLWMVIKRPALYIGGALYLFSAVLNIYVLRALPYSVTLPMMSITYIWTLLLSAKFLKERITGRKIAGVALVIFGAVLLGMSF